VIPPTNDPSIVFTLAVQLAPLITQVNNTSNNIPLSHVNFELLALTYGRTNALQMDNANFVKLDHINMYGFSQGAAQLSGTNLTVNLCTISQIGCSGVAVYGGNPMTLVGGDNVVSHNQITNYAQLTRSYSHGVTWEAWVHWWRTILSLMRRIKASLPLATITSLHATR
jgi:hypothetical protein